MSALLQVLGTAIEGAVRTASPGLSLSDGREPAALAETVVDQIRQDPVLAHLANDEPWYRSRVTLGALVSAGTPVLALLVGREITADEQTDLMTVLTVAGTLVGAAVTLYGRWVARRPLGR